VLFEAMTLLIRLGSRQEFIRPKNKVLFRPRLVRVGLA
jgi:hypothetical protein